MAPGEGVDVQDAQGEIIFINPIGFLLSRHDPAENTGSGFDSFLGFGFCFFLHPTPILN
jgi:hypothetical protein